jgi:hypothetical protein
MKTQRDVSERKERNEIGKCWPENGKTFFAKIGVARRKQAGVAIVLCHQETTN